MVINPIISNLDIIGSSTVCCVISYYHLTLLDIGDSVLWSLYPRYEISHEHVGKTLEELAMCPSATIFVISPETNTSKQARNPASLMPLRVSLFYLRV